MAYKSETLKAVGKDAKAVSTVDAAIAKVKAAVAYKARVLREDQIKDGVQAVAEIVAQHGPDRFTAREIGKMIGYTEAFVAKVIAEMEAE